MASHDAFTMLPDCLLSFILSKIPLKDAVKCSILSKRWRFLYTHMPALSFSLEDLGFDSDDLDPLTNTEIVSKAENIISSILLLHSRNLEALHIWSHTDWDFSIENECRWVRYAAWCNVQTLTLCRGDLDDHPPHALFSCSRLVTLSLIGYVLTTFPTQSVGFPHLISCELRDVQLTNESLASLLSLCPLLQKLEITGHSGLDNVVIFSPTIEHLEVDEVTSLSVECPKLKLVEVRNIEDLEINGVRFYELSYAIHKLEMQCGGILTGLSLFCSRVISESRFLDIIGNFQSLKDLVISLQKYNNQMKRNSISVPLVNLLYRLPNLQSLCIRNDLVNSFFQALARDPISESLASPLFNLKKIQVLTKKCDHKAVAVISYLLQHTPFLETMEIQLPQKYRENHEIQCMFLKDILSQRRASSLARIFVVFSY